MPDSGALRQRRSKAHKSGDHSLCRRNCSAAARLRAVPAPPPGETVDAREGLHSLAATLQSAHQADPANAPLARELRMTLQAILDADRKPAADDELAGLFAAFGAS